MSILYKKRLVNSHIVCQWQITQDGCILRCIGRVTFLIQESDREWKVCTGHKNIIEKEESEKEGEK